MNFRRLSENIAAIDQSLRNAAIVSVNRLATVRNWLIGRYIVEYEQCGRDRAKYAEQLLPRLASSLGILDMHGASVSNLRNFRQFYLAYPALGGCIEEELRKVMGDTGKSGEIHQKPSGELSVWEREISQKASAKLQSIDNKRLGAIDLSPDPGKPLVNFSFSHFVELMRLDDPLKRAFYEIEGLKGNWSVPQLKRQIESLLFERTGMSKDKAGLVNAVHAEKRVMTIEDAIRDPYVLEFTGFPESHQFSEFDLETRLLDHIQLFLLELGNGFCFEARQKRITLDNEHDRIDLVFYHRILRCHVLIDLKVRKFQHGDAGQMNFYLNYYRANMMAEGDNPPVGLILCASRDETRVKYATAGMDNRLFVSKYLTALPSEEKIMAFLRDDRDRTENVLREEQAAYHP